jgi:ureidoacrylate peracid hydrolase
MATVSINARPQSLEVDLSRAAVIVNDMQNAFCSAAGYIDRIGFDIRPAADTVAKVKSLCDCARATGVPVFFMQNGFSPDVHEAPGPSSPLWWKSNALRYMRENPEQQGRILTHGTWDYEFVEDLQPQPGDIIVRKATDNGFSGTGLDSLLRGNDIQTMLVCGISSNVGVESTLRAGYHLGYFGLMVADACMAVGPAFMQEATEFSIANFFGWVSSVQSVTEAFKGRAWSDRK